MSNRGAKCTLRRHVTKRKDHVSPDSKMQTPKGSFTDTCLEDVNEPPNHRDSSKSPNPQNHSPGPDPPIGHCPHKVIHVKEAGDKLDTIHMAPSMVVKSDEENCIKECQKGCIVSREDLMRIKRH
ncbi:uncharacterized protein LOC125680357 isoform X2 [Ostrea edulis]|uniref:uncharacterized protein LOC125680357 isoform X2 n=1 Tax=Ostrea edulis TaxID=37623 RepID=UPI0020944EC6|nr:uncharacterized protein LOC125680357 isoform X2 [Ostrea edulis]